MSDIRPVLKSFRDIMDEVEELWRRDANGKPIPDGAYKFMWRALRIHFDLLLRKEDIAMMDMPRFIQYIREEITADDYPMDAPDKRSEDSQVAPVCGDRHHEGAWRLEGLRSPLRRAFAWLARCLDPRRSKPKIR